MATSRQRLVTAFAVGLSVSVGLNIAWDEGFRRLAECCMVRGAGGLIWVANVTTLSIPIIWLVPGFVTGWIARSHGIVLAVGVSVVSNIPRERRVRRRLGDAAALTQFGVNLADHRGDGFARAPGAGENVAL